MAIAPALDGADADQAAETLTGLIGAGLLDYANALGPRCHTVCLVTVGAERVGHQDAPPSAGHAALAAMHRSIGFDHPEQTFTHLDLPSWELTPGAGSAVVDAVASPVSLETALRSSASGYALFERSFRDAPAALHMATRLRGARRRRHHRRCRRHRPALRPLSRRAWRAAHRPAEPPLARIPKC